jgi:hypothetical protein
MRGVPCGTDMSLGDLDSSARETSGSPTPPPQNTSIFDVINTSPCAEVKRLLRTIWAKHPLARTTIDDTLRRPIDKSGTLKRKAFEKCKNCGEAYDVEYNDMGDCRYHPGKGRNLTSRSLALYLLVFRIKRGKGSGLRIRDLGRSRSRVSR